MSQRAAYLINQIAQIHDGRIVSPFRRIAKTSGAESFAPSVNELSSMPPKKKRPQIEPKPIITFVLSRMHHDFTDYGENLRSSYARKTGFSVTSSVYQAIIRQVTENPTSQDTQVLAQGLAVFAPPGASIFVVGTALSGAASLSKAET